MSSIPPIPASSDRWYTRFAFAFVYFAVGTFFAALFYPPGQTLGFSAFAAVVSGIFFGLLAALFGKRMLDFLTSIPW